MSFLFPIVTCKVRIPEHKARTPSAIQSSYTLLLELEIIKHWMSPFLVVGWGNKRERQFTNGAFMPGQSHW